MTWQSAWRQSQNRLPRGSPPTAAARTTAMKWLPVFPNIDLFSLPSAHSARRAPPEAHAAMPPLSPVLDAALPPEVAPDLPGGELPAGFPPVPAGAACVRISVVSILCQRFSGMTRPSLLLRLSPTYLCPRRQCRHQLPCLWSRWSTTRLKPNWRPCLKNARGAPGRLHP